MSTALQSTPYTPVFPPPLPTLDVPSLASVTCDSALALCNDSIKTTHKSYIDRLKERHLLISGLPEVLCPPSRESSPGAETRIEALALRMRKARDSHLPLELVLTCVGVQGGDWVGAPSSDDIQNERQYCLPATEEEWFEWEKKQVEARQKRRAEKKAAEYREKIEKWSEKVEKDPLLDISAVPKLVQGQGHLATNTLGYAVVKGDHWPDPCITSRYFSPEGSPDGLVHEHSEPVERALSPLPPSQRDQLPDFCDSFSLPDSPLLLPHDTKNHPIPAHITHSPSFAVKDTETSTPLKLNNTPEPIHQLSSPISPLRRLRPLAASQTSIFPMSLKRSPASDQPVDMISQEPSTPRDVKRARTVVEPITPKSVWRSRGSQDFNKDPKRLPTLDALLATSSRKSSSRKGTPSIKRKVQRVVEVGFPGSPSLRRTPSSAVPEFSPSQPTYSMFRPKFQSTQSRAFSLPPNPSQPMTSILPISPQKTFGCSASSGIGLYQSQFNVESKVDQVAAFLDADVWDTET